MVVIFHQLTRADQCSRSFAKSSPRCEGGALASVTFEMPLGDQGRRQRNEDSQHSLAASSTPPGQFPFIWNTPVVTHHSERPDNDSLPL
jgi:hypothetical protein